MLTTFLATSSPLATSGVFSQSGNDASVTPGSGTYDGNLWNSRRGSIWDDEDEDLDF